MKTKAMLKEINMLVHDQNKSISFAHAMIASDDHGKFKYAGGYDLTSDELADLNALAEKIQSRVIAEAEK